MSNIHMFEKIAPAVTPRSAFRAGDPGVARLMKIRPPAIKAFIFALSWLAAMLLAIPATGQSAFPNKPVTLVVGFPAGTNPDIIARELAKSLSELWGQPAVIVNRSGAGGVLATEFVSRAIPDGLTLYLTSGSALVTAPFLYKKLGYDPITGVTPIAMVADNSMVLITNSSAAFKTFKEFVAAAKANPGGINYGSFGVGSLHHISMEQLQRTTGIRLLHIPYGNNGPLQDLLAGNVNVMWSSLQVSSLIASGKLNAIAYSGTKRLKTLPNVPTVSEMGFPGFATRVWFGVVGPAGLPPAIVKKVQNDVETVVTSAAFRNRMAELGNETNFLNSEDFMGRIQKDFASNKALFDELKIEKE